MLFAGDRNIIGFLQSFPPKPIYGDAGLFAEKRPDSPPVVPGGPPWPGYPNPMPPGKDWIMAANPSFDIGGGHKGANKAAKIYNKIRANDNMNEVETIKRILGGPSLPTF